MIFVSATPGPYEREHSEAIVEQIIRPTGLLDPSIEVKPTKGQIDDLLEQVRERAARKERVLVTTLTKRMAEDLADYLQEMGVRTHYLHSEIDTLERVEILRDLRLGVYDVVVGINLLREGLDLPEVSLVCILDADKEGYLRSGGSLIQTIGRAARHVDGHVIMYADTITDSMRFALDETDRRRAIQLAYNEEHGISPEGIQKAIRDITDQLRKVAEEKARVQRRRQPAEGRDDAPGEGPGEADEDGGEGAGVREGGLPARPGHRAAQGAGQRRPSALKELAAVAGQDGVVPFSDRRRRGRPAHARRQLQARPSRRALQALESPSPRLRVRQGARSHGKPRR